MNILRKVSMSMALFGGLTWTLTPTKMAFAQDERSTSFIAAYGGIIMLQLVLAYYLYSSLALQTIAAKTKTEKAWMAWIPIANLILMLNIARKSTWWIILFFIPLVNIAIIVVVWMRIAEARGKPSWWGVLLLVPFVGFIVPGYLAWAD